MTTNKKNGYEHLEEKKIILKTTLKYYVIRIMRILNTTKQKTSSSGNRTLTDGVTGAHSNRCTYYLYISLCMSITCYEIKSNTRLPIK